MADRSARQTEVDLDLSSLFELRSELGRGGMGIVFRALQRSLAREVALKVLLENPGVDEIARRRFLQEARLASRIKHGGVVEVLDSGSTPRCFYIAYRLIEGESLRQRLEREGTLPIREALAVIVPVLDALQQIHAFQVVHRDIKPENILIEGGTPLVADLGIARLQQEEGLTRSNVMIGTPTYMAPEQMRGEPVTAATDLYAVGITLHELISGIPPFRGKNAYEVFEAHLHSPVPPLPPGSDPRRQRLGILLTRALEKDPRARFSSAEEFRLALEELSDSCDPSHSRPAPTRVMSSQTGPGTRPGRGQSQASTRVRTMEIPRGRGPIDDAPARGRDEEFSTSLSTRSGVLVVVLLLVMASIVRWHGFISPGERPGSPELAATSTVSSPDAPDPGRRGQGSDDDVMSVIRQELETDSWPLELHSSAGDGWDAKFWWRLHAKLRSTLGPGVLGSLFVVPDLSLLDAVSLRIDWKGKAAPARARILLNGVSLGSASASPEGAIPLDPSSLRPGINLLTFSGIAGAPGLTLQVHLRPEIRSIRRIPLEDLPAESEGDRQRFRRAWFGSMSQSEALEIAEEICKNSPRSREARIMRGCAKVDRAMPFLGARGSTRSLVQDVSYYVGIQDVSRPLDELLADGAADMHRAIRREPFEGICWTYLGICLRRAGARQAGEWSMLFGAALNPEFFHSWRAFYRAADIEDLNESRKLGRPELERLEMLQGMARRVAAVDPLAGPDLSKMWAGQSEDAIERIRKLKVRTRPDDASGDAVHDRNP